MSIFILNSVNNFLSQSHRYHKNCPICTLLRDTTKDDDMPAEESLSEILEETDFED